MVSIGIYGVKVNYRDISNCLLVEILIIVGIL